MRTSICAHKIYKIICVVFMCLTMPESTCKYMFTMFYHVVWKIRFVLLCILFLAILYICLFLLVFGDSVQKGCNNGKINILEASYSYGWQLFTILLCWYTGLSCFIYLFVCTNSEVHIACVVCVMFSPGVKLSNAHSCVLLDIFLSGYQNTCLTKFTYLYKSLGTVGDMVIIKLVHFTFPRTLPGCQG